jgi:hypothetical protein
LKGEGKEILEFLKQGREIVGAKFTVLLSDKAEHLLMVLTLKPFEDEDLIDYTISIPVSLNRLDLIEISDSDERAIVEM